MVSPHVLFLKLAEAWGELSVACLGLVPILQPITVASGRLCSHESDVDHVLLLGQPHPSGLNRVWKNDGSQGKVEMGLDDGKARLSMSTGVPCFSLVLRRHVLVIMMGGSRSNTPTLRCPGHCFSAWTRSYTQCCGLEVECSAT